MAEVECNRVAGMSQRQRDEYQRTLPSTVPARKVRVRPVSAANVGVPCHVWNSLVATVTIRKSSFLFGAFLPALANYPRSTVDFTLQFICCTTALFLSEFFCSFFLGPIDSTMNSVECNDAVQSTLELFFQSFFEMVMQWKSNLNTTQ